MSKKITRRQALLAVSSALLLPVACSQSEARLSRSSATFAHGVASGDPAQSSIVIWTRVSEVEDSVDVDWTMASDANFLDVVARGQYSTDRGRDHTIKIVVDNLAPGQEYYYQFAADGSTSPTGRTRTLPVGHVEQLVVAVATCSNYPFGYFNAYEVIANDPSIDLVVHLGDYIYEYDENGFGGEAGKRIGRIHEPRHEIVSLDDYRRRHAQYKTDQGSLAMHARHPLIVMWDDHETANNPWMDGASNHQPEEGSWAARRAASLQAFYEWLPIRDPGPGGSREKYWRHYKFGDLVSLITLENRHTGRSQQISYDEHLGQIDTPEQAQEFLRVVVGASNRSMLSLEMEGFLKSELKESVSSGRRWRLIGNQTLMAKSIAPVLDEALFDRLRKDLKGEGARILGNLTRLGELGLPEDMDIWDGYPVAREKFYQIAKDAGARDLLVLSGDSHSYWTNSLFDAPGLAMGIELGATGISSPRSLLALGAQGMQRFDELNATNNKEIEWTDGRYLGFIRLRIDHERAHADFVTVSDVESLRYTTQAVHAVDIVHTNGSLGFE